MTSNREPTINRECKNQQEKKKNVYNNIFKAGKLEKKKQVSSFKYIKGVGEFKSLIKERPYFIFHLP